MREHSTYLTSVDWSADSKYIRSTDGAQELLYFNIPEFKQDKFGKSNTVDTVWATNTAKFGWHVQVSTTLTKTTHTSTQFVETRLETSSSPETTTSTCA